LIKNFKNIVNEIKKIEKVTVSVAAAHDEEVLKSIKMIVDNGIANSILVGDKDKIEKICNKIGLSKDVEIIDEKDTKKAALIAVKLVKENKAHLLLKGLINTADYMKAVLDKAVGLRQGKILSHLAAYEVPGNSKILFMTDSGVNISPNKDEKKEILDNAFDALKLLGIDKPKVAVLSANERVNEKMPNTLDAKYLEEYFNKEEYFKGIVEGPIALDVAVSKKSAEHKGIDSKVSGEVDIMLFPDVESGNIWSKSVIYYAKFNFAGVILGATNPVILVSRNDSAETKFNSIALACLLAAKSYKAIGGFYEEK
jgi:phosphate butyryltransferase